MGASLDAARPGERRGEVAPWPAASVPRRIVLGSRALQRLGLTRQLGPALGDVAPGAALLRRRRLGCGAGGVFGKCTVALRRAHRPVLPGIASKRKRRRARSSNAEFSTEAACA